MTIWESHVEHFYRAYSIIIAESVTSQWTHESHNKLPTSNCIDESRHFLNFAVFSFRKGVTTT